MQSTRDSPNHTANTVDRSNCIDYSLIQKRNDAERYNNIGAVMMSHDYLRYRLTGEVAAELTNTSGK
ncbi:hypothetical protein O9993_11925 [Vibrio lentus]|nr:hypothetical protein [Vibrio lentus]